MTVFTNPSTSMARPFGTRLSAPVLWFTGLSGSGKSTIATRLHQELLRRGMDVEYIDGDALREVFPNTGFTRAEREEHLRRTGYMASRLAAHGVAVVASFVSPYRESREFIRRLCPNFGEIYIATPLEECERRDVKGLYARARRGELRNFTGIDDPYEPPDSPELTLDTRNATVEECVNQVLARFADNLDRRQHGSPR
jgi:adenylylsulfate kinase